MATVVKPVTKFNDLTDLKSEVKKFPESILIKMEDGKITGKSGFNLKDFLYRLKGNLKHVLFTEVLEMLGVKIIDGHFMDIGENKVRKDYILWLNQREEFKKKSQQIPATAVASEE